MGWVSPPEKKTAGTQMSKISRARNGRPVSKIERGGKKRAST